MSVTYLKPHQFSGIPSRQKNPIHDRTPYVFQDVTIIHGTAGQIVPASSSESRVLGDADLAALLPSKRMSFMARYQTFEFILIVASAIACLVEVVRLIDRLMVPIRKFVLSEAHASETSSVQLHDIAGVAWDFVPLILIPVFGIWALWTIRTSKDQKTVTYAKDVAKVVLGSVIGSRGH